MLDREDIIVIIGAVIAFVLDVIVSPNLVIFSATPNFCIAYVIVVAMVYQKISIYLVAFALGLLADIMGFGPLGSLSFLLVLSVFICVRVSGIFNDGTLMVALATIAAFILMIEIFHAVLMLWLGSTGLGAVDALMYMVLPCSMFDIVLGLILYPLMAHLLVQSRSTMGSKPPVAHIR